MHCSQMHQSVASFFFRRRAQGLALLLHFELSGCQGFVGLRFRNNSNVSWRRDRYKQHNAQQTTTRPGSLVDEILHFNYWRWPLLLLFFLPCAALLPIRMPVAPGDSPWHQPARITPHPPRWMGVYANAASTPLLQRSRGPLALLIR